MKETTYERYRRVLMEIAGGCPDPAKRADEALALPTAIPDPAVEARRAEALRRSAKHRAKMDADHKQCLKLYNEWLIAGRPPIATFARTHNIHRSSMERRLEWADRRKPYQERRLAFMSRDAKRGYPTTKETEARWDAEDAAV